MIEALRAKPLAGNPADHSFLVERAGEIAGEARARIEEATGPLKAVLLGGSLARGEGTVWRGRGGPRVLSDIDLVFVTANEGARDRGRAIAPYVARGLTRRLPDRAEDGAVDLGVYAPGDLVHMGPRPGTLELVRSGRVLAGPHDATAGLPALEEKDVPREEAIVLLENRGIELLLAWPGDAGPGETTRHLNALYAGLKAWLDGAFAFVVAHGRCPANVEARQAALEALTVEGRSEVLRAVLPDSLPGVAFWSGMKLAPDPAAIALRLRVRDPENVVALARRGWSEGARAWLGFYRALGALDARGSRVPGVAGLARHAAHRARLRRRLRRWAEVSRDVARDGREGRARWALRPWPERLPLVLRGAPEHELAACGAVLLAAWSGAGEAPGAAGPPDWRRTMRALFPGRCPDTLEWDRCRTAVVRLWDTLHMAGTRTAWEPDAPRNPDASREEA